MDNGTATIQFDSEEFKMILKYQEESGATTVQNAILNAISVALDSSEWE